MALSRGPKDFRGAKSPPSTFPAPHIHTPTAPRYEFLLVVMCEDGRDFPIRVVKVKRLAELSPIVTVNERYTHLGKPQKMRLAEFILHHVDAILGQWDAFAATQLPAASQMTALSLRDHGHQILVAIAKDLRTLQTREAQIEKSKGLAPVLSNAPETAAQTHAILRARSGFNINQLAAEYRALRASVIRLWIDEKAPDYPEWRDDLVRFNEAIDQGLAESIAFFSNKTEESRNLLLGMLGHDMRTPLQTIQITASYLSELNMGAPVSVAAARLINSGVRIKSLLDDLLDYNRTKLGLGIRMEPKKVDLTKEFNDELIVLCGANPSRQIDLKVSGDSNGVWDSLRLRQLLANLVQNAIKYGAPNAPVQINVQGDDAEVVFEVVNQGPPIEPSKLHSIFDPLRRGLDNDQNIGGDSLGLGLYIAREIANGHGGDIKVRSDESHTTFKVHLPRQATQS
jgi:signal transduction histidine kinase